MSPTPPRSQYVSYKWSPVDETLLIEYGVLASAVFHVMPGNHPHLSITSIISMRSYRGFSRLFAVYAAFFVVNVLTIVVNKALASLLLQCRREIFHSRQQVSAQQDLTCHVKSTRRDGGLFADGILKTADNESGIGEGLFR